MKSSLRKLFNESWTEDKYKKIYDDIVTKTGHLVPFRIAETPVFLDDTLWQKLVSATENLITQISDPAILSKCDKVFEYTSTRVPNESPHPKFIQFDFGICANEDGTLQPKLIELQGFPSLYYFQTVLAGIYKSLLKGSVNLNFFADGIDEEKYYNALDRIILNGHNPKNVIIMEVEPEKQNTYIDLLCTSQRLGIEILCISKIRRNDRKLYYINNQGAEIEIKRIYNRIIFDELDQRKDLINEFDMLQEVDVEWAGHPNWFFKLSKFTMPYLHGEAVPNTYFLNQVDYTNLDLSQYVLKPLFSFSGAGVEIDIDIDMLNKVAQKDHYILQEKVSYVPLVEDVNGELSKFEVRMMVLWPEGVDRPFIVNNLIRLSKGKMVGVKYNKDKIWVGGSIGFRE